MSTEEDYRTHIEKLYKQYNDHIKRLELDLMDAKGEIARLQRMVEFWKRQVRETGEKITA